MQLPKYYEDPSAVRINTMPDRAYCIPFSDSSFAQSKTREESDRFQLLNGKWKFKLYQNIPGVNDEFVDTEFDDSSFEEITVPSVWQTEGYDTHQYTNTKYPIPYDPPFVPFENPCGAYETWFDVAHERAPMQKFLNFEGVDSCIYLWINGRFVGFNKVSHSTGEFDITQYVHEGRNKLAALVLKWCDGTYLEDQDKLRMSGIFRDVYLLYRPQNYLRDFFITTAFSDDYKKARIDVSLSFNKTLESVDYLFTDGDGNIAAKGTTNDGQLSVELLSPTLWNAENPYLYTMVLSSCGESISEKVGLRDICVKDGVVYLNGVNIKIKGANRHDSNPYTGYTVSAEQMREDILMMKRYHINAVRTSHYPNSPLFTQMCDEYGLYVIAEADIEAHGGVNLYGAKYTEIGRLAADPQYKRAILDRVQRSVERDKNRPSIIMWSLGNESGYGENFVDAAKWVHTFDSTRLVHYESSIHPYPGWDDVPQDTPIDRDSTDDTCLFANSERYTVLDVYSHMYAPTGFIKNYFNNGGTKPLMQCEFCHAMGNGPGDLEDYFELIYKYDGFLGGLIWEWCDHAVFPGKTEDGRDKFLYGGDFGEFPNDGNFCVDGLVLPDRRPSTGLMEYKNVIRPVRATAVDISSRKFSFRNCLDFMYLSEFASINYEITQNGAVVERGKLSGFDIAPHETSEVNASYTLPKSGRCFIRFVYTQLYSTSFAKFGDELGFDQFELPVEGSFTNHSVKESDIAFSENDTEIVVNGSKFKYVFSKPRGLFASLEYNEKQVLSKPMEYNIWRAPTDNDMYIKEEWVKAGYDRIRVRTYDPITAIKVTDEVVISCSLSITPVYLQPILRLDAKFSVSSSGEIKTELHVRKSPLMPTLPRFGIRLFLPKSYDELSYFGYGPYESYADKHRASYKGLFTSRVAQQYVDYLKPQENASHCGCEYVNVNGDNSAVQVTGEELFYFNASEYTQEEFTEKRHDFELVKSGCTVLCIDYKQNGIGSNSCGPELLDKYRFDEKDFNFTFTLSPDVNAD